MAKSVNPLVLAFDGGGTSCRAAACGDGETVSVETGPANATTDLNGAVLQITQGLGRLAELTGRSAEGLAKAPTYIGLAGVTGPAIADELSAALPFKHAKIGDDRLAVVRGVLGRRDGVIGHCGTGSFFAAQIDRETRFSGGWGPELGDDASAQWLGRKGLALTLEAVDGLLTPTPLSQRFLSDFGDAASIVRFAGTASPADFGALAPTVTEYAERGDAIAEVIMQQGAKAIARDLVHLGWRPGLMVCLSGGLGSRYNRYLPEDLRENLGSNEGEPIDGAISIAQDFAMEIAGD